MPLFGTLWLSRAAQGDYIDPSGKVLHPVEGTLGEGFEGGE